MRIQPVKPPRQRRIRIVGLIDHQFRVLEVLLFSLQRPVDRRTSQDVSQVADLVSDARAELSAQLVVARLGVFDRVVQERRGFVSLPNAA